LILSRRRTAIDSHSARAMSAAALASAAPSMPNGTISTAASATLSATITR
jgi:hypothetical protein